jgi:hypothetical protein
MIKDIHGIPDYGYSSHGYKNVVMRLIPSDSYTQNNAREKKMSRVETGDCG